MRGMSIEYLNLIYAGKEYRPNVHAFKNKTLCDIGIKEGSTLFLVTRQLGGYALNYGMLAYVY